MDGGRSAQGVDGTSDGDLTAGPSTPTADNGNYLPTANGLSWQSNDDIDPRRKILEQIVKFLQRRIPEVRPEWIQKVPLIAKRLEGNLYLNAASFEEYNDHETLGSRLQELASRLETIARIMQTAALRQQQQQQRLPLLRHASKCPAEGDQCNFTPHCQAMKQTWEHIAECKNQQCPRQQRRQLQVAASPFAMPQPTAAAVGGNVALSPLPPVNIGGIAGGGMGGNSPHSQQQSSHPQLQSSHSQQQTLLVRQERAAQSAQRVNGAGVGDLTAGSSTPNTGGGSASPAANGLSWQSNDDIDARRSILARIVNFLKQRRPDARPEWIQKVPLMAERLEDNLYRSAANFEEYNDHETLRSRLQELASRLGTNAQATRRQHQQQHRRQRQPTGQSSAGVSAFPSRSIMVAPVAIGAGSGGGSVRNGASGVSGASAGAGGGQAGSVIPAVSGGGMGVNTGVSSLFGADAAVVPPTSGAYGGPFPDRFASLAMTGGLGNSNRDVGGLNGIGGNFGGGIGGGVVGGLGGAINGGGSIGSRIGGGIGSGMGSGIGGSERANSGSVKDSASTNRKFVNINDINPLIGGGAAPAAARPTPSLSNGKASSGGGAVPESSAGDMDDASAGIPHGILGSGAVQQEGASVRRTGGMPIPTGGASVGMTEGGGHGGSGSAGGSGAVGGVSSSGRGGQTGGQRGRRNTEFTAEDRKVALRQQQQRLLLLRHACKCPAEGNQCKVTPHCQAMKRLWKHIAECKNQQCPIPHCVSSRFVLSHYHRCKDLKCSVCAPVREVITKSHNRQMNEIRKRIAVAGQVGAAGVPGQHSGGSVGNASVPNGTNTGNTSGGGGGPVNRMLFPN